MKNEDAETTVGMNLQLPEKFAIQLAQKQLELRESRGIRATRARLLIALAMEGMESQNNKVK